MDDNTMWLLIKIGITAGSLILLWLFKRKIMKVISDIITGNDTEVYQGKTVIEIRDGIEATMDEVLQ